MKKFIVLLLVLAISSVAGAGTMIISGLPGTVNASAGPVVLSFDIVSNVNDPQLDNDSLYVWTYTGGTLDMASAINRVEAVPGTPNEMFDDSPNEWIRDDHGIDITNMSSPNIWADISIPKAVPLELVGDIVSDLGLTVAQGWEGFLEVKVLSENDSIIQDVATIEVVPEPVTIALLGLGGLFLRRRK